MKNLQPILAAAALAVSGLAIAQDPVPSQRGTDPAQRGQSQSGQAGQFGQTGTAQDATASYEVVPSDKLIGLEIKDRSGEKLTQLSDLIIDKQSGEIRFALVETGGLMGIGGTERVVPWQHIEVMKSGEAKGDAKDMDKDMDANDRDASRGSMAKSEDHKCELKTTLTKDQLERAPELGDERNLGQDLERRVQAVFGQLDASGSMGAGSTGQSGSIGQTGSTGQSGSTAQSGSMAGATSGAVAFVRLSKLEGLDLHASSGMGAGSTTPPADRNEMGASKPQGEKIGSIEKIVLAPKNNVVAFAVVNYDASSAPRAGGAADTTGTERDGAMGGDRKIAVPWQQLKLNKDNDNNWTAMVSADQRQLASAPEFNGDDWRRVSSTAYLQQVYSHFQAEPFWRSSRFASSPRTGTGAGSDMGNDAQQRQRDMERQKQDMERQRQERERESGSGTGGTNRSGSGSGTGGG